MVSLKYNTLKAETFAEQIFLVDWSETCKFRGINFHDSAIYLKFCGWCLERSQNDAIGGKINENGKM